MTAEAPVVRAPGEHLAAGLQVSESRGYTSNSREKHEVMPTGERGWRGGCAARTPRVPDVGVRRAR